LVLSSPTLNETHIFEPNQSYEANITLDEYYTSNDIKYNLSVYAIPNKTGEYNIYLYFEYEYQGQIKYIEQHLKVIVILPNALDNE